MTNRISNKICFWTWRKWCLGIFCSLNSSIQRTIKFPGGVTFIHLKTENSSYDYRMHAIVTRTYECMKDVLSVYHHRVREWKFSLQKWRLLIILNTLHFSSADEILKVRKGMNEWMKLYLISVWWGWLDLVRPLAKNMLISRRKRNMTCTFMLSFWFSGSSESVCHSPNGNFKVFIFCSF